jgi:hypothetical protein
MNKKRRRLSSTSLFVNKKLNYYLDLKRPLNRPPEPSFEELDFTFGV